MTDLEILRCKTWQVAYVIMREYRTAAARREFSQFIQSSLENEVEAIWHETGGAKYPNLENDGY